MPTLLVVHHTPSPTLQAMLEAVRAGAALVEGVEVVSRPALAAGPVDLLAADGVLLGTPANIGHMSGARSGQTVTEPPCSHGEASASSNQFIPSPR